MISSLIDLIGDVLLSGVPWTEEEHKLFLLGLQKVGKGDWRGISRNFVKTRTPTQVASHAQKYFLRRTNHNRRRRRSSLFDITADTVIPNLTALFLFLFNLSSFSTLILYVLAVYGLYNIGGRSGPPRDRLSARITFTSKRQCRRIPGTNISGDAASGSFISHWRGPNGESDVRAKQSNKGTYQAHPPHSDSSTSTVVENGRSESEHSIHSGSLASVTDAILVKLRQSSVTDGGEAFFSLSGYVGELQQQFRRKHHYCRVKNNMIVYVKLASLLVIRLIRPSKQKKKQKKNN